MPIYFKRCGMNLTWLLGKHIAACEDFPERKRKVIDDYKYSHGTLSDRELLFLYGTCRGSQKTACKELLSERIRGKL